jgi:hypothetical protein
MSASSSGTWKSAKGGDIRPGDRVRTSDGSEVTVTRIEENFFGTNNMLALIEDTPERWFKRPVTIDADVEILAAD